MLTMILGSWAQAGDVCTLDMAKAANTCMAGKAYTTHLEGLQKKRQTEVDLEAKRLADAWEVLPPVERQRRQTALTQTMMRYEAELQAESQRLHQAVFTSLSTVAAKVAATRSCDLVVDPTAIIVPASTSLTDIGDAVVALHDQTWPEGPVPLE